jgi:signal transduction histidine kinase
VTLRLLPTTRRAFARERAGFSQGARWALFARESVQPQGWRSNLRYASTLLVVALCYFLAAKLGLSLAVATEQVTAFWPPTGIALAALLLAGYRVWPGIFLGALIANATSNEMLLTAAGIAVGNTATGLLGAFLLRSRYKFHATLERTRDVVSLVAVAVISTVLSSTLGTLNLIVAGIVSWPAFASVWWVWWVGDTLGIMLIAPFLLSWATHPRFEWRGWRLIEYAALFSALAIVSYFVFAQKVAIGQPYTLMAYATFPFLIWAALRFEQREVVSSTLIIAAIAVWGAAHNRGLFAVGTLDERLISFDTFVGVVGMTALLLGATTAERRRSRERLRRARNEMERRVLERTAQLERANAELSEFSYSMSHDLRAPLRAVNAYSELLAEKYAAVFDSEALRLLAAIAKNSRQMGRMIDDYLRLIRLRSEPLEMRALDVHALVRELIVESFDRTTREKVRFDVRALPVVVCDSTLIRQVFANLLSNAVKFSWKSDPPLVEIGGRSADDEAIYYVKDNGIGFDMQWSDQLFKVFRRLHPREFDGDGIGLATVACIVQRHGGRVRAEGAVGQGSTFSFSLPHVSLA